MTCLTPDLNQPTCRVCLQNNQDEEMSSIFDLDSDCNNLHIYEKIEQCSGIKIIRHEKIPTLICKYCYGFLKVSYKFRTICRNSNEFLKEFVVSIAARPQLEKCAQNKNPLQIDDNAIRDNSKQLTYKNRLTERASSLPPTFDHVVLNTPSNSVDLNGNGTYDELWFDGDGEHHDDLNCTENLEVSIGNSQHFIEESDRKLEGSKNTASKTSATIPSKTLEISSDGAAIIREKKSRATVKKSKKEKQSHICDVCGNIYDRRYALEVHMRRHTDDKPFECELCSQAFHCNFELTRHIRKHTGSRPYKCNYCARTFGDRSTLIKHERIHRNERPYKCETCGKSFTYSNVLKSHILTHTGEKPYNCDLCGKCFTRAHHLRAHLETLQHQNDPRSKVLLKQIKKSNDGVQLKLNFTIT